MALICCRGASLRPRLRLGSVPGAWSSGPAGPARQREEKEERRRRRQAAVEARSAAGGLQDELRWTEPAVITYDVPTHPGEKKDTSVPLPDAYSPQYVEAAWYAWWEAQGFFKPEYHARLPHRQEATFALCIPPPNVTGSLHLGHALTVAIQDAVVRWHRMCGVNVLWVPGCDHAGIATQVTVEKELQRQRGIRRTDLSREGFLQEVWKWKEQKGDEIHRQLRRMGASLDWDRARFTMDLGYSEAVTEAFVQLHEAGLVYRSQRLVNWSCALNSAISDIEVESKALRGRTLVSVPGSQEPVAFGELHRFAYVTEDQGDEVVVATTRPETMVGDVAVAVHPQDGRYSHLHGKWLRHPFADHLLPIITDPMVDPEFGTGAVKVTPGHDHVDHELALRHQLPILTVIHQDGTMAAPNGDWLKGVQRFDARHCVLAALHDRGLFRGSDEHAMVLRLCSRSGDVVEPLLKSQWFINCYKMAESAMAAVDRAELSFLPPSLQNIWNSWLSGISDWCVSRQLWWGHRIPAYRVTSQSASDPEDGAELWAVGRTEGEARVKGARQLGVEESEVTLMQDADVLDTWFSSALFPFAALGWPRETADLRDFYPNSLLVTGSDLIFFWVARMVMLGHRLTGELPFPKVLFHPLVRDSHGRKMSKSLGNVIDPLDVMCGSSLQRLQEKLVDSNLDPRERNLTLEAQRRDFPRGIPECGTDALRFALCSHRSQGEDINVDLSSFLSARRFCNKIWNALRFTLSVLPDDFRLLPLAEVETAGAIDAWILGRLHHTVGVCERGFRDLALQPVTSALHHFWLHQLCDVYLECIKPVVRGADKQRGQAACQVLVTCADTALRLLSPLMPYLTEELWQRLPGSGVEAPGSVVIAPYPSLSQMPDWSCPQVEADFLLVQEMVRTVRSLRANYQLTTARPELYIKCRPEESVRLRPFLEPLQTLSRSGPLKILEPGEKVPEGCAMALVGQHCQVHLLLQGVVDPRRVLATLERRQRRVEGELAATIARMHAPGYEQNVPDRVRHEEAQKVDALQTELEHLREAATGLEWLRDQTC